MRRDDGGTMSRRAWRRAFPRRPHFDENGRRQTFISELDPARIGEMFDVAAEHLQHGETITSGWSDEHGAYVTYAGFAETTCDDEFEASRLAMATYAFVDEIRDACRDAAAASLHDALGPLIELQAAEPLESTALALDPDPPPIRRHIDVDNILTAPRAGH